MKKNNTGLTQPTQQFFSEMLNIEMSLQNQNYTFQDIDKLIQLYAQAVEYYDCAKDPIKSYFMEKMQILLINKESLRLIVQEQERVKQLQKLNQLKASGIVEATAAEEQDTQEDPATLADTNPKRRAATTVYKHRAHISTDESDSDEEDSASNSSRIENEMNNSILRRRNQNYSISRKRSERSKDFNFMIKVQDGLKNQKSELDGLLSSYEMTIVRNDEFIQENIDKQLKKLRERINQRKLQSFYTQTMNISKDRSMLDLLERPVAGADRRWDSFLADLTEEERDNSKVSKDESKEGSEQNKDNTTVILPRKRDPSSKLEVQSLEGDILQDFLLSPIRAQQELLNKNVQDFFVSKNNPKKANGGNGAAPIARNNNIQA